MKNIFEFIITIFMFGEKFKLTNLKIFFFQH